MSDNTKLSRLLIVSYHSGMSGSAASHHIDDRLPEFVRQGVECELISSVCGVKNEHVRHFRVLSGLYSGWRYEIRHFLRQKIHQKGLRKVIETACILPIIIPYAIEKLFVRLDATWSWFIFAVPVGVIRVWVFKPDGIYVTGGAVSSHATGLLISRLTGVPFVSEFQDPIVYQLNPKKKTEKRYNLWLEKKVMKYAGKVIFLTKNATKAAQERAPEYAVRLKTIYPGLIPLKKLPSPQNKQLVISHFGTLAGSRNLDLLIQSLQVSDVKSGVEIHLYGHLDSGVKTAIDESGLASLFKVFGKVPREEALRRMADADVLLLMQNKDDVSIQTIPSKVYEYMQTGKLILSFSYKNTELDELLHRHGHFSADLRDMAKCSQLVKQLIESDHSQLSYSVKDYHYDLQECVSRLIGEIVQIKN